jgi:RNA polymerase sigma-70 factor (ECF subfamily)
MDETTPEITRQAMRQWTLAQPVVSAFLHSVVREARDRDDLLQEIAVAVLDCYAKSYEPQRPFLSWALGVARNQVGLYLRRRRRDRLVFDEATMLALSTAFMESAEVDSSPLAELRDCLQQLARRSRELIDLRYEQDLKPAAIAERMGMTANAVAKALQRIREQLKACLEFKTMEGSQS